MAARLKIIRIPRTPASAFNQHREASDLVRNQVRHAHQELHDWWKTVGRIDPNQIRTEQEASDYIRTVTRILHPEGTQRARSAQAGAKTPPARKSGVWLDDPMAASHRDSRRRSQKTRRARR
jgi:hypothetical protein